MINSELSAVLERVSAACEPPRLLELYDSLLSLVHLEQPGVSHVDHGHPDYLHHGGRVTVGIGSNQLVVSSLQEVEWTMPLEDAAGAFVRASADMGGNHHPLLQVIRYGHLANRQDGSLLAVRDKQSTSWLGTCVDDLAAAEGMVADFWNPANRPPESILHRYDSELGQWVVVDR